MPKKKSRRKAKTKIPMAATIGAIGSGMYAYKRIAAGDVSTLMAEMSFGASKGNFQLTHPGAWALYGPVVVGATVSAVASKLGLNRYLRGIPFVKI